MSGYILYIASIMLFLPLWLSAQTTDSITWNVDLENVVVTAQYAPTDAKNAVHRIHAIRATEFEKRGATNLEQLLLQESNIRVNQDLVLGSSLSLLGVDGQGVKIMIDGIPIVGRQGGNIDLSQVNLNQIERVEIVEGPLAVNYGTDALGGVVNLITKKSQIDHFNLEASAQVESAGEDTYNFAAGFRPVNNLLARLWVGYDRFEGIPIADQRSTLWNPKEQWQWGGSAGYRLANDGLINYRFQHFDETVDNLGDIRRPQFKPYSFDDLYYTERVDHALSYDGKLGNKFHLKIVGGYNQYDRTKNTFRKNFDEKETLLVEGEQDTSQFKSINIRATLASVGDHFFNYMLGVEYRSDEAFGERIVDKSEDRMGFASMRDLGVFGTARLKPMDRLNLELGLRVADNSKYETPIIPSLHLKYQLSDDLALRGSYAYGFRSPDLKELFFNFIDINHFIVGNTNLLAEQSRNFQLGAVYSKSSDSGFSWNAEVNAFYNSIEDKIELYEFVEGSNGELLPAIDTSTFKFAYFNQDLFKAKGVKLAAGIQKNNFSAGISLTHLGHYNAAYEIFSDVDRFTFTNELSADLTYSFTQPDITLSAYLRSYDRSITYFPDLNEQGEEIARQRLVDGYTLINFSAMVKVAKNTSLTLGVKNILDIQNTTLSGGSGGGAHSGSGTSVPVGLGRSLFARLSVDL